MDEVLAARADRVAMVRDFLATVTDEALGEDVGARSTRQALRPFARAFT